MSDSLKERFNRFKEQSAAASRQAFAKKAAHKLCSFFVIDDKEMQFDPEYGFEWIRQEFSGIPVYLEAIRLRGTTFEDLASRITKTKLWEEYFGLFDQLNLDKYGGRLAVVFEMESLGLYVMHNWWALPQTPGHTRLTRVSSQSTERGIVVEPYDAFLLEMKETGWNPYH